ncbi:MAG: hypothetical protein R3F19_34700 [Verrucomicrobiales bacterium]
MADNIVNETALSLPDFIALLNDFAEQLRKDSTDSMHCWTMACRRHQFKGAPMPDPVPSVLGRADTVGNYAGRLADSCSLSTEQCGNLIRKVALAGTSPVPREIRLLRKAPVGRYLIWATFSQNEPTVSPFASLPRTAEAIRTALGLRGMS